MKRSLPGGARRRRLAMLSLRIDLPRGRIGPGKVALLEAIAREGSISAAGRTLGMSYKRAWDLVAAVNASLGAAAVETSAGGRRGGGAVLSAAGRALIADYRAIERAAHRAAGKRLAALERRAGSAGRAPRPSGEHDPVAACEGSRR